MKLEDFVYSIVQRVFWELEHGHHFVIPEAVRKKVLEKIRSDLDNLIKEQSGGH
jgi:hypothetical protein